MSIKFNPTGYLNITADPMDLPEQAQDKTVVSGAMTRCKNLDLDYAGIAKTRKGSTLKSAMPCTQTINHIQVLDSDRYEFGNSYIYKNESFIDSAAPNDKWDSFVYLAFNELQQSIFATNGVSRKRIRNGLVEEWGIDAPVNAPTILNHVQYVVTYDWEITDSTQSAYKITYDNAGIGYIYTWEDGNVEFNDSQLALSTGLWETDKNQSSDKYQVCYTYARYNGSLLVAESNPSPNAETSLENFIYVTWDVPTDASITHVRFYRSLPNFYDLFYCNEFAIDAVYGILSTTDEALGTEAQTDHDRPPLGGSVVCGPDFNGISFMGVGNVIYYSKSKQPEYWPALYNVQCGSDQHPIVGIVLMGGQLYAATNHEIYQIQGTGVESFFPLPMAAVTGTQSKDVFLAVKGYGIFHIGYDGLYLYTGSTDIKISSSFSSIWKNETKHGIPPINKDYIENCLLKKYENKIWFGYPSGVGYCNNWLVLDLESNLIQGITSKIQYYTYPWDMSALAVDENIKDILAADISGYIHKLDDISSTLDSSQEISWEIESKQFGALRKYFPRWARYDVSLVNGATATGSILLNENIKQTHPITRSRWINKRLIDGCTGDRISIRIAGTGPVKIYSAEVE